MLITGVALVANVSADAFACGLTAAPADVPLSGLAPAASPLPAGCSNRIAAPLLGGSSSVELSRSSVWSPGLFRGRSSATAALVPPSGLAPAAGALGAAASGWLGLASGLA